MDIKQKIAEMKAKTKKPPLTQTERRDLAAREDRERFFKVADTLDKQPKYAPHLEELEALKQWFRDMTKLEGYPNIKWAPTLPSWFPNPHFASSWEVNEDEATD